MSMKNVKSALRGLIYLSSNGGTTISGLRVARSLNTTEKLITVDGENMACMETDCTLTTNLRTSSSVSFFSAGIFVSQVDLANLSLQGEMIRRKVKYRRESGRATNLLTRCTKFLANLFKNDLIIDAQYPVLAG